MNVRRSGIILGAMALVLGACVGSGGGTSGADAASSEIELRTTTGAGAPVGETLPDGDSDAAGADPESVRTIDTDLAGVDEAIEELLSETQEVLDAIATECSTSPGRVAPGADFSHRTFSGPDLRCADLSEASFEGAVLDGVDLSGADLTGADFTGATIQITAVGADFTRATLTGADFRTSDLRGAVFASADMTGSSLTSLPGGITLADLSGATLGCNYLHGSPGVSLAAVTVADDCKSLTAFHRITLAGSWYGASLGGLDFGPIFVQSTDFRRADLSTVDLADYGVFPAGVDFSGALLSDANLSGVGFYDATFVGVDFSGADLSHVYAATSDFSAATFHDVAMTGFGSERSLYFEAMFDGVDLTNGSLSYDDFTDALFGDIDATGLVIDTISCPGAVSSIRYGLCTVGAEVAF